MKVKRSRGLPRDSSANAGHFHRAVPCASKMAPRFITAAEIFASLIPA